MALNSDRRHIALVIAGGCGNRMQEEVPKQFLPIHGVPLIVYTLRAFQRHSQIDGIVVVCIAEWVERMQEMAAQYGITKLILVVPGGLTSQESTINGVRALKESQLASSSDILLVHDAVRPLISERIITENIAVCSEKGNAVTVIRGCESFLYSEDGVSSDAFYNRENMYRVQTPHTFTFGQLVDAFAEAEQKNLVAQSLYVLMAELHQGPFYFVEGEQKNFKLTYPEDLIFLRIYLEEHSQH